MISISYAQHADKKGNPVEGLFYFNRTGDPMEGEEPAAEGESAEGESAEGESAECESEG